MKRIIILIIAAFFLLFNRACIADPDDIKLPVFAGAFYPSATEELSSLIDGMLDKADPAEIKGDIFALISPHAGYGYSGQTAAFGYKLLIGRQYKTVVILGTSHQYGFSGVSVYPKGKFRTPLGDLEIDEEFTQKLLNRDKEIIFEAAAFAKEHSVEVQLPFLQRVLTGSATSGNGGFTVTYSFKIVPVIMGDCSLATCQKFARFLKEAIGGRKDILIIASTDMYHGYDYQEAEAIDATTTDYLKKMDAEGLYYALREGRAQLCGGFGVVTALYLAGELKHDKLSVLNYTHSAKVTGQKSKGVWTVGYISCAIDKESNMLNKAQKKRLLEIARKSIEAYLKTGKDFPVEETDPLLSEEMGAFVTLRKSGELRGCIGNIVGREPLYLTIRDMAREAAFGDPRFPPLGKGELSSIEIEISVLTPLEKVGSAEEIELGKHGVLVKKGFNSGVYLPQVATETGWTKEEFLSSLCAHKAGLSPGAWKDKATELYTFSAEVFSESELLRDE